MTLARKYVLNAAAAQAMLRASVRHANEAALRVAIAIVDDGGHPLLTARMDGAAPMSAYIALDKARTAAVSRRESKLFEDEINAGRHAFLSVPFHGLLEGGVPVAIDGEIIAAIGVAGCKPGESAAIARAGIAALQEQLAPLPSSTCSELER